MSPAANITRFVELIQGCCLTFWVSNQALQLKQKYSPTSIIRTSIIRISQLPGVCLAFKKQKQRSHASQLIKNIRLRSSWLRVALLLSENELLTSPQLSDEQILESVVEQSSWKMKAAAIRKMKAKMRKLFRTLRLLNALKSVYYGWKDRTMLTLSRLCSFEEWWNSQCARDVLL